MSSPLVFLSYSRRDAAFAKQLHTRLRQSRMATWQDTNSLRAGKDWREGIDDALRRASALIVIVSPHAAASQYVTYEWAFAMGARKPVIPVLLARSTSHERLATLQAVDLTTRRKRWVQVINAVREAIPQPQRLLSAPTLRAKFEMEGDRPKRNESPHADPNEYVVLLSVDGTPRGTTRARYEVHDPSFDQRKWTEKDPTDGFGTWMSSYGDVLVTCVLDTPNGKRRLEVTLSEGLERSHGRDRRPKVRRALRNIREN